jgi:hypothetical protein
MWSLAAAQSASDATRPKPLKLSEHLSTGGGMFFNCQHRPYSCSVSTSLPVCTVQSSKETYVSSLNDLITSILIYLYCLLPL